MRIDIKEQLHLPVETIFDYFRSPTEWTRLYGLAGEAKILGNGWVEVPIAGFPFPLVAKVVSLDPQRHVRWIFRGFWKGDGELNFHTQEQGVLVSGYERISVRPLGPLSTLLEKLFLESRFRFIWALGWNRLRKRDQPQTTRDSVNEWTNPGEGHQTRHPRPEKQGHPL